MPNVWDPGNLKANLRTLGELVTRPAKSKLSNPNSQGRYGIDEYGVWSVVGRTFTPGETILNDQLFRDPLTRLFEAGTIAWHDDTTLPGGEQITHDDLEKALAGLEKLKETYSDDADRRTKMDTILSRAREQVYRRSHPRLEPFRDLQLVAFEQWTFTPGDSRGVCRALALDWLRRRLVPKSGNVKRSFAEGSKGNPYTTQGLTERMRQVVETRVGKVQQDYETYHSQRQDLPEMLDHYAEYRNAKRFPHYQRYAGLAAVKLFSGPSFQIDKNAPQEKQGKQFFEQVLARLVATVVQSRFGEVDPLPASRCFILDLGGTVKKYHSAAVHVDNTTISFMEPNIGEYRFRRERDEDRFVDFGNAYWNECAFRWHNVFTQYDLFLVWKR